MLLLPGRLEAHEFCALKGKKGLTSIVFPLKHIPSPIPCETKGDKKLSGDVSYSFVYCNESVIGVLFVTNKKNTRTNKNRIIVSRDTSPEQFTANFELERLGLYLYISDCGMSTIVQCLTLHRRVIKVE